MMAAYRTGWEVNVNASLIILAAYVVGLAVIAAILDRASGDHGSLTLHRLRTTPDRSGDIAWSAAAVAASIREGDYDKGE